MKKKVLCILLTVLVTLGCFWEEALSATDVSDVKKIKSRLVEFSLDDPDVERVKGYMDSLQPNGSWADIDYEDKQKTGWEPLLHLRRLSTMANAYRHPDNPLQGDPELRAKMLNALDFWFSSKIRHPSQSWTNLIGIPKTMGEILLLLENDLTPEQMRNGVHIMDYEIRLKKWKKEAHLRYWWNGGEAAGQNKLWLIRIRLMTALFRNQLDEIKNCFASVEEELTLFRPQLRDVNKGNEGVQADFSFHQHGPQLYSGGYGLGFAIDIASFLGLAHGTQFEFSPEKQSFVLNYILEGQQWMIYRGVFDYSSLGREISRKGIGGKGNKMLQISESLSGLNLPRQKELDAFIQRLRSGGQQSALSGNRHFWCSDFSVHRRADYYASVKMNSTRTLGTETGNGEGLQSFYLADGCTLFMLDGSEYSDIFPVWDWTRIPGVTCEFTGTPPEMEPWGNLNGAKTARRGHRSFVGGVSDGTYGLSAMDYQSVGVAARKAWFYFENEIVCLGAGITCDTTNQVVTSVNQCLLSGDVVVDGIKMEEAFNELDNARSVFHDGIGYLFPEPASIRVEARDQSGSWKKINRRYPDTQISKPVFSLWIDHGIRPDQSTYSYVVIPNSDPNTLTSYMEQSGLEILVNTPQLQAVRHRGLKIVQAAFYQKGVFSIDALTMIQVDQPCLLMLERKDGKMKISAANPENEAMQLNVEITRLQPKNSGSDTVRVKFDLPDGLYAGITVTKEMVD